MRLARLWGVSGGTPKAERDAAPARRSRKPSPGRPWAAVRPHYGGLPSVAGRGGMRGGESPSDPGGSSEGSPSFPQRKNGPGDGNRRRWSAGRRLSPIARGKGTLPSVPGGFAPAQEASQASAFPGALLPIWSGSTGVEALEWKHWSGSTWSGRGNDRPRPGLTTNGRAERCLRRSAQREGGANQRRHSGARTKCANPESRGALGARFRIPGPALKAPSRNDGERRRG